MIYIFKCEKQIIFIQGYKNDLRKIIHQSTVVDSDPGKQCESLRISWALKV